MATTLNAADALKPCPFCGSPAIEDNTVTEIQIRCAGSFCGARIKRKHAPRSDDPGREQVTKAWNRRDNDAF